jgi:hypothetical protein
MVSAIAKTIYLMRTPLLSFMDRILPEGKDDATGRKNNGRRLFMADRKALFP